MFDIRVNDVIKFCEWLLLRDSKMLSWCASYSSRFGNIFSTSLSKLGSALKDLRDTSFFRHVGHSLFPDLSAVTMHSAQNLKNEWQTFDFLILGEACMEKFYLWRQSLVVIVFVSMSRQIGQVSSLCKDLAETAISVSSVMTS